MRTMEAMDIAAVEPGDDDQLTALADLMRRLVLAGRSSFGHGQRVRDHNRAQCDSCRAVVQAEAFLAQAEQFQGLKDAAKAPPEA